MHLQILPTLINSNLFAFNFTPDNESQTNDTIQFIIDQNIGIISTFRNQKNEIHSFFTGYQDNITPNIEKAGNFILECESHNNIGSRIISRKISINLNGSKIHKFNHYIILDFTPKTLFELRNIIIGKMNASMYF